MQFQEVQKIRTPKVVRVTSEIRNMFKEACNLLEKDYPELFKVLTEIANHSNLEITYNYIIKERKIHSSKGSILQKLPNISDFIDTITVSGGQFPSSEVKFNIIIPTEVTEDSDPIAKVDFIKLKDLNRKNHVKEMMKVESDELIKDFAKKIVKLTGC